MIIEGNHFQHLVPGVNRIMDGKNRIYYSEFNEYYSSDIFRNFSIKVPLQGNMHFKTENNEFDLKPGFFLLSYKQAGELIIESTNTVRSLCIDIQQETINEAFAQLAKRDYDLYDLEPDYFFSNGFFEHVYSINGSDLGISLAELGNSIMDSNHKSLLVNGEIFLKIAEKVVLNELSNYKSLCGLNSVRTTTKKETLKRLLQGKDFIDGNYLQNPSITEISRFSNLSSFHFFRSFKQAFDCSPYQYMLQKRLDYAVHLIDAGMPMTQIALACSFPDLFTFSKAFKRIYKLSPSKYRNRTATC